MFNNKCSLKSAWVVTLLNAVAARWLDGKCQRLLATELKVQHCWTLKTTVGDCWRQSPTCAGDSRQLKYKHTHDCRRLSPSRATVGDSRRLEYKPGLIIRINFSPAPTPPRFVYPQMEHLFASSKYNLCSSFSCVMMYEISSWDLINVLINISAWWTGSIFLDISVMQAHLINHVLNTSIIEAGRWIPFTKGQLRGNVSIWCLHHEMNWYSSHLSESISWP